ncbi:MAG: DNA-directed RNA polymerase subunit alpha C-terminal domain-containing protein, partial [Dehalococcoidia bacterium]
RAYNCLRRSGLMTVGQVLEKSEEELLTLRNFGRKSYDELRVRLDEMGLLPADLADQELMEAPPLGEEETPIVARRPVEVEAATVEAPAEPEPAAPAKKSAKKGKAAKAAPSADDDAGEEIPDWKRALLELTGEGDAAEGEGA